MVWSMEHGACGWLCFSPAHNIFGMNPCGTSANANASAFTMESSVPDSRVARMQRDLWNRIQASRCSAAVCSHGSDRRWFAARQALNIYAGEHGFPKPEPCTRLDKNTD